MNTRSTIFPTTILVLLLLPGLVGHSQVRAQGADITDSESLAGPNDPDVIVFELGSQAEPQILDLSLPPDVMVVHAAVTVNPGPQGNLEHTGDQIYPEEPQVDVGADGSPEWMFEGVGYGAAGRQTLFGNGSRAVLLGTTDATPSHSWSSTVASDPSLDATVKLPRGSQVSTARLLITPQVPDDWWDLDWAQRIPISIEADPDLGMVRIECQVRLTDMDDDRDIVKELRLTRVTDEEVSHPFWVGPVSNHRVTIGFDVSGLTPSEPALFHLYFDNPQAPSSVAMERGPVPVLTVLQEEALGPFKGPSDEPSLSRPYGLFVDGDRVLVADTGNHRVVILGTNGELKGTIGVQGTPGADDRHLNCPHDVAVDNDGRILVADTCNHRVQIFAADGTYLSTLGSTGVVGMDGAHMFFPWSLALDADGGLYVSDMGNDRVQYFDTLDPPNIERTFGETGVPGGSSRQLDCPRGLYLNDGLYVADAFNSRVQYFKVPGDGWADMTIGLTHIVEPSDVAVGPEGIFVADGEADRISVFGGDGFHERDINGLLWPQGVTLGPGGDLWIADTGHDRIVRMVPASMDISPAERAPVPKDLRVLLDEVTLLERSGRLTRPLQLEDVEDIFKEALAHADCASDPFGNDMCLLHMTVEGLGDSSIIINDLDIRYDFSTRMSLDLAGGTSLTGTDRSLPLKASSKNGGTIVLDHIDLTLDHPPFPNLPGPLSPKVAVQEETSPRPLIDLDEVFSDESDLRYEVDLLSGPASANISIREDGWLILDLSGASNFSQDMVLGLRAVDIYGQVGGPVMLEVPVMNVADAPVFLSLPRHALECGSLFHIDLNAEDGDDDSITYHALEGPDGLDLDPSGGLSWRPMGDQMGEHKALVVATDGLLDTALEMVLNVSCPDKPITPSVERNHTIGMNQLLKVPLNTGRTKDVELLRGPTGMKYDVIEDMLVWRPTGDQAGPHLVHLRVGTQELTLRIIVERPGPWIQLKSGPNLVEKDRLTFTGLAGGNATQVLRVEGRIDNGQWSTVQGTYNWRTEVDISKITPGIHRLEIRSYDGMYSEPVHAIFLVTDEVAPSGQGARGTVLSPISVLLVIFMVLLGGVVVIKRIDGHVYCVHRAPEGPTMCIPLGAETAQVGGMAEAEGGSEDEEPDVQARPSRCYLCLGMVKRPEDQQECPRCSRPYHKACARRLGSCPICGGTFNMGEPLKGVH
jgi:sugar lactone lactonase YvrE